MASNKTDEGNRTLYCGNLSSEVDEEILYELFVQAGPLEKVSLPMRDGTNRGFGFIIFKHECSVPYAMELFRDTQLFGREPILKYRNGARAGDINSHHQRSYSLPTNFSGAASADPPMDFDALLAMSKNILSGNPGDSTLPMGMAHGGVLPMGMGAHSGYPVLNGMGPPGMQFMQYSGVGNSHSRGAHPESYRDGGSSNINTLSANSLQGNWSAPRNNSNLLPHSKGREHRSRQDESADGGDSSGRFGYASQSWDRARDRERDRDWSNDRHYDRKHPYSDRKRSHGRSGYGHNNQRRY